MEKGRSRKKIGLLFLILTLIAGFGAWRVLVKDKTNLEINGLEDILLASPQQLTAFNLRDINNKDFNLADLKDHWTFLFFGYTNCPDVCPTTLSELADLHQLLEKTPEGVGNTQVVFVSIDPERDTLSQLKSFVNYFNPRFIGATGSFEKLNALTDQLGANYRLVETEVPKYLVEQPEYEVEHSAALFLIDPKYIINNP